MRVYLFPVDGAMAQQVQGLIKLNCVQSILSLFSGEVSVKVAVRIPNAGAKEIRLMWGLTVRTLQWCKVTLWHHLCVTHTGLEVMQNESGFETLSCVAGKETD